MEKQDSSVSQSWVKSFRKEGAVHLAKSCKEQRQSGAEKMALDLPMGMSPGTFANQRQRGTENCVRAKASCHCEKEGEMKLWKLEKVVKRGKRVVERRDGCGDMMFEQHAPLAEVLGMAACPFSFNGQKGDAQGQSKVFLTIQKDSDDCAKQPLPQPATVFNGRMKGDTKGRTALALPMGHWYERGGDSIFSNTCVNRKTSLSEAGGSFHSRINHLQVTKCSS